MAEVPMNVVVKLLFLLACLLANLSLTPFLPGHAEELTFAEVINKAGRQRMLTQRITKSYCQIGLNVNPEQSEQQLKDAVALFDDQLRWLQEFAPTVDIGAALDEVRSLWVPFKQRALSEPTRDGARQLWPMDEKLLQASETLVQLVQDLSGSPAAPLVNIVGRQRMLSQRLGKFYMLQAAGLGTPSMSAEQERAKNEFRGALESLRSSLDNTGAINEKLDAATLQWGWLESALEVQQDTYFPLIVADASEKTLVIMESLTDMYEQVAISR